MIPQKVVLQLLARLAILATLLLKPSEGYQGFDCGQGSAHLILVDHVNCHPVLKVACFEQLYFSVQACTVKAWPREKPGSKECKKIRILANVTDINAAVGDLSGPVEPAGSHADRRVRVQFRRPDEMMHISFGTCTLMFDAWTVNSSSLPDPDADGGGPAKLPEGIFLPLMLLPFTCLAFLFVAGGVAQLFVDPNQQLGDDSEDPGCLQKEASRMTAGSSSRRSRGHQQRHGQHGSIILRLGASGLISSGRRGLKRLRRGSHTVLRPLYIGDPHESSAELQKYATGSIAQSPKKVAPFFRFPPSAIPPGLPIILEAPQEGHATLPITPEPPSGPCQGPASQQSGSTVSAVAGEVVEPASLPSPSRAGSLADACVRALDAGAEVQYQGAWFSFLQQQQQEQQQQQQQSLPIEECTHGELQVPGECEDVAARTGAGARPSWWEWWSGGRREIDEQSQALGQLHQRLL